MRKFCTLTLLLAATSFASLGCRMCANCFDYAGPVHEAGYANDGTYGRAGSINSGRTIVEGETIVEEVVSEPTLAE